MEGVEMVLLELYSRRAREGVISASHILMSGSAPIIDQ